MNTSKAQTAVLQAIGIDLYQRYEEKPPLPPIATRPWFSDLLDLLQIDESNCEFTDESPISFEPNSKTLTLPISLEEDESVLKRRIWQCIQHNVTPIT